MRKLNILFALCVLLAGTINAQPIYSTVKQGNIWMIADSVGLDFNFNPPKPFLAPVGFPDFVVATICDTLGRLKYFDKIQNTADQLVMNRDSQWIPSSSNPVGHYISMNFFLPFTGTEVTAYVSYENVGSPNYYGYSDVYYSLLIDSLNLGKGSWATPMNLMVTNSDSLRHFGVGLTRHANGRDWWMIAHRFGDDTFYVMLATPDSMNMVHRQKIGSDNCIYLTSPNAPANIGDIVFSKDGTRLINANAEGLAEVFDFDRCTGLLSNPMLIEPPDSTKGYWNVCFSPNGRYVYASQVDGNTYTVNIVQYDLQASNPALNKVTLYSERYDKEVFRTLRLGPDNKIYLLPECGSHSGYPCTMLDSTRFSIIHNPDSGGFSCNFALNDLYAGRIIKANWPTMAPNYDLGPIDGSPCDTLNIDTRPPDPDTILHVSNLLWSEGLKVYPNPVQTRLTLESAGTIRIQSCVLYDIQGRPVMREQLDNEKMKWELPVQALPPGQYVLEVFTQQGVFRRPVTVMRE